MWGLFANESLIRGFYNSTYLIYRDFALLKILFLTRNVVNQKIIDYSKILLWNVWNFKTQCQNIKNYNLKALKFQYLQISSTIYDFYSRKIEQKSKIFHQNKTFNPDSLELETCVSPNQINTFYFTWHMFWLPEHSFVQQ